MDFNIFFKGILMGISDLIPGISGGTIAFITGIYERLIKAISNISYNNYIKLFSKNWIEVARKLDLFFLITLFSGVFISIILGSKVISYLLSEFYIFVFAFFIGLILASSRFIFSQIEFHDTFNKFVGFLGFIFGFSLMFLVPGNIVDPSFLYLILGGFLAIFALFLPGISGSFILVVLGLYEYIINAVKEFNLVVIGFFGIGALIGVFVISRFVTFLFKWNKNRTLYFLLGLVLGSLAVPFNLILSEFKGELISVLIMFALGVLGFITALFIERF